jgi:excinuclease ABC subunit C
VLHENDKKRGYARPCLLYHIKRCSGPCSARISRKEYREDIDRLISFLEGKKERVLKKLEEHMIQASEEKKYEDAARLRDEMLLLGRVSEDGYMLDDPTDEIPFITPEDSLSVLKEELLLESTPVRIEGIDISHTGGDQSVGAVVSFIKGMPFKDGYRRFKIKGEKGRDDIAMIEQVVTRRIRYLKEEDLEFPDILLVDGGRGQVEAAFAIVEEFGVSSKLNVIGLAKENEMLYFPGNRKPVKLAETSPALKLLCYVRDEAHRFAQLYHKLLRKKDFLE